MNLRDAGVERAKIAARLRTATSAARTELEALTRDIVSAEALATELEGETPPPLEEVLERGRTLFRRRGRGFELAELRDPHVDFASRVALSPRSVVVAMTPAGKWTGTR